MLQTLPKVLVKGGQKSCQNLGGHLASGGPKIIARILLIARRQEMGKRVASIFGPPEARCRTRFWQAFLTPLDQGFGQGLGQAFLTPPVQDLINFGEPGCTGRWLSLHPTQLEVCRRRCLQHGHGFSMLSVLRFMSLNGQHGPCLVSCDSCLSTVSWIRPSPQKWNRAQALSLASETRLWKL